MLGSICELMGCRASDLLLDDRPDAWLRFEIDFSVTRFWSWFKSKMQETRTEGKKQIQKYRAEDLLADVPDIDPNSELWLPPSYRHRRMADPAAAIRMSSEGRVLSPSEVF